MTGNLTGISNRWLWFAFVLIALCFAIIESFGGRNDWDIFLAASRGLFDGIDIYADTYFDGYHYYYSLLFAMLVYPFALLPAALGKFIWICLNMLLIVRIFRLLWNYFAWESISIGVRRWIFVLTFFGVLRFLKSNLHLGQTTILILYLSLEALHAHSRSRWISAGFFLALAINIKLLPAVFLPYWLYRNGLKSFGSCLLWMAMMWSLPLIWISFDHWQLLTQSYIGLINPNQQRHVLDVEETSFHGLSTLLSTLFSSQALEHNGLPMRRYIMDCSLETLAGIIAVVRLFFVMLTLYFMRTMPMRSALGNMHSLWEISYLMLAIPLIAPHQQHYAFLFALPAVAYVGHALFSNSNTRPLIYRIAFFLVLCTFNAALWLGMYNAVFNHYKILTYGALLLVVLLAALPPSDIKRKVGTSPTFE